MRMGSIVFIDTRGDAKGFQADTKFSEPRPWEEAYLAQPAACYDPPRVVQPSKGRVEGGQTWRRRGWGTGPAAS